jgi:RND family efflux transporter MFP subunit
MNRLPALLLAGTLLGCSEPPAPPAAPRPVLYTVVQAGAAHEERFAGSIQARYETVQGFRTAGRIASRAVDVGTAVSAGELLATLDPTDQQNALQASEGEMASAQARWLDARTNAQRRLELVRSGVGAKADFDAAQTREQTSRAALEQKTADVRNARDQLAYTRVAAEFAGVVTAWHVEVGQVVSAGQPLLTLAHADIKEAVFDLPDGLLDELPADALFQVAPQLAPEITSSGKVREVAPQADAATRTRRVRLSLSGDTRQLHLGTTVVVRLLNPATPRTRLPETALRHGANPAPTDAGEVWVIDPASLEVQRRPVQLSNRQAGGVTVTAGLRDGEWVVRAGANSLRDGQRVTLAEGSP